MDLTRPSAPLILLAAVAAAALLPPAAASGPHVVYLHDLVEKGAYVGCHVTNDAFATFRLNVPAGTEVVLDVRAPENNTNPHYLTVEGVPGRTGVVTAGQSETFRFTVDETGSKAILCDENPGPLQGILRVTPPPEAPDERKIPGPGALGGLVALAAAAAAAGLARRRRA